MKKKYILVVFVSLFVIAVGLYAYLKISTADRETASTSSLSVLEDGTLQLVSEIDRYKLQLTDADSIVKYVEENSFEKIKVVLTSRVINSNAVINNNNVVGGFEIEPNVSSSELNIYIYLTDQTLQDSETANRMVSFFALQGLLSGPNTPLVQGKRADDVIFGILDKAQQETRNYPISVSEN